MADALALLSLRRIVPDYAGACVRLRRSSDDAESDFAFGLDGLVDRAAIHAWLGSADPFVRRWHAQDAGERHAEQATKPGQPKLVLAADDGLPEIVFDGNDDYMVTGALDAPTDTLHVFAVSAVITNNGADGGGDTIYDVEGSTDAYLLVNTAGNRLNAGTNNGSDSAQSEYVLGTRTQTSVLYSPEVGVYRRDGALVGEFAASTTLSATYMVLGTRGALQSTAFANASLREILAFTEALPAADERSLERRQLITWGVQAELPVILRTSAGAVRTTADGRVLVSSRSEVPAPPSPPSGLSFDRSTGTLTWRDQPDATHFDVYKAEGLHGALTEVASGLTTTSYAAGVLSAEEQAMLVVVARHARTGLSAASRPIALSNLRL